MQTAARSQYIKPSTPFSYSREQWRALVLGALRGVTPEQVERITDHLVAEQAADRQCGVWHASATVLGHRCNCWPCRMARNEEPVPCGHAALVAAASAEG